MTVKQLIKELKKFDENRVVVLSRDQEGNGFEELYGVFTGAYNKKNRNFGLEELTPELKEQGYSKEDIVKGKPAVVLWP